MRLIPVIDVQHGHAVHAIGGARETYQQLRSPFSASTTFTSVADALRTRYQCPELYVADLDAIEQRNTASDKIIPYARNRNDISIWLDRGVRDVADLDVQTGGDAVRPVVATETLIDEHHAKSLLAAAGAHAILSLDFKDQVLLGAAEILDRVDLWPGTVIVMTLDNVGRNAGPDIDRVAEVCARAGRVRQVFAAGGVRDVPDLKALAEAGASGALVASALHTGKIKPGDLEEIAGF